MSIHCRVALFTLFALCPNANWLAHVPPPSKLSSKLKRKGGNLCNLEGDRENEIERLRYKIHFRHLRFKKQNKNKTKTTTEISDNFGLFL